MMHECTSPKAVLFLLLSIWSITDRCKWADRFGEGCNAQHQNNPLWEVWNYRAGLFRHCSSGFWFSARGRPMESVKLLDKRAERWEEVDWGCGLRLEACGWLCWFTACQSWSLLNSEDKCSQMLWPYYGKEVCCGERERSACGMNPSQPLETQVCLCPLH